MRAITASACYASATMQPNGGGRVVTNTLSEDQLVQQLRAGDEAAYELLVRTYSGRMLSVARRLLACEEDARDAVQEAFIAAFRSLDRFEGAARVSTWLHRIEEGWRHTPNGDRHRFGGRKKARAGLPEQGR